MEQNQNRNGMETERMQNRLLEMIDAYKELLDEKDRLKAETTENNKAIERARGELAQVMIDEECPKVSRNGYLYSLADKVKYNRRGGIDEEDFFQTLEDNGLGDIIKRTVSAQTLNSAMAALADENEGELPEDFEPYINPFEYYDITKRKETNRAARNAKKKGAG